MRVDCVTCKGLENVIVGCVFVIGVLLVSIRFLNRVKIGA